MENLNLQYIRKTSRKIIKNKYLTYFVALFTIFFVSESLINSDNVTFIKLVFKNNVLKILVFSLIVIIGYFNITLGFLLLLNFVFVINIPQRVEGFANSLPNLIDKNEILKYKKNFVSNEKKELKYKSNEELAKSLKNNDIKGKNLSNKENEEKKIDNKSSNNKKKNINNPIRLEDSERVEEISKKMKRNQNLGNKNNTNSESDIDNSESDLEKRKKQLRKELEELEQSENEINNLKNKEDDTIESDIKKKDLDKRLRLNAMKEEEDESSSESSNSSGSSSSSSYSSDESGKDYDEVSINDARDHVMKKLRNKLKRKYVKDT